MKLGNTFKLTWWILLLLSVSSLLILRYSAIVAGNSSATDIVILLSWIGLMLAPMFQGINPAGLKLQQSVESLKEQIRQLMFAVQTQTQTQSVHISNYPPLPTDSEIADRRREAAEVLGKRPGARALPSQSIPEDPDISYLANLRRSIETELSRVAAKRAELDWDYRRLSLPVLTERLVRAGALSSKLAAVITDIYAISTAAMHGEPISPNQRAYAKELGPALVQALSDIR